MTIKAYESRTQLSTRVPHVFVALEAGRPHLGALRVRLSQPCRLTFDRLDDDSIAPQAPRLERTAAGDLLWVRLGLRDSWMSANHATLTLDERGVCWIEDGGPGRPQGSTNGTFVFDGKVRRRLKQREPLQSGDWVEMGRSFVRFRTVVGAPLPPSARADKHPLPLPHVAVSHRDWPLGFASALPSLARSLDDVEKIATTNATSNRPFRVFVAGETGCGKELVASVLHRLSQRPGRLVVVNCATLRDNLAEYELCGIKKGAVPNVAEREGTIAAADRGTLFLDEIGKLDGRCQGHLLRAVDNHEVRRIGDNEARKVDFNLVCAAKEDIGALRDGGRFLDDLLARLMSGAQLLLPAFRDRREDLALIVGAILDRVYAGNQATAERVVLNPQATHALLRGHWRWNMRGVRSALENAMREPLEPPSPDAREHLAGLPIIELGAGAFDAALEREASGRVVVAGPAIQPAPPPRRKHHDLDDEHRRERARILTLLHEEWRRKPKGALTRAARRAAGEGLIAPKAANDAYKYLQKKMKKLDIREHDWATPAPDLPDS